MGATIILVLLSPIILANFAHAQILPPIFPNTQNFGSSSTLQKPPTDLKLHLVKITSPTKGQQVQFGKDLLVYGTSADNNTSNCSVSVKVNFINPYHNAVASGNNHSGAIDYSKWNFTLSPTYTSIKQGQNKLTAKFSCSNNPILVSYYSVNVTGVKPIGLNSTISTAATPVSSNTAATPVSSNTTPTLTGDNKNKLGALSVLVHVDKNSLHAGDKETITIRVVDKNTTNAITGASVSGRITSPSGPFKKVEGTTDNKGKASYSWTVSNGDTPGKYKLIVEVSASGYKKYLVSKTFSVTPISFTSYANTNTDTNTNNNPHPAIIPSNTGNSNSNRHNHHDHPATIIPSNSGNTNTDTNTNSNPPPLIIPSNSPVTLPSGNSIPSNSPVTLPSGNSIPSNSNSTSTDAKIDNNRPPSITQSNSDNKIPFLLPFH
jgi:hypothetical protein